MDLVICTSDLVDDDSVVLQTSPIRTDHAVVVVSLDLAGDPACDLEDLLDWKKTDCSIIVDSLNDVDWQTLLRPEDTVDAIYGLFLDRLHAIVRRYVPPRSARRGNTIDTIIARLLRRIYACSDEDELERLRRQLGRKRCIVENSVASSRDPARFFGYAVSRLKLRDDLALLVSPAGSKVLLDEDKANLLCDLFENT